MQGLRSGGVASVASMSSLTRFAGLLRGSAPVARRTWGRGAPWLAARAGLALPGPSPRASRAPGAAAPWRIPPPAPSRSWRCYVAAPIQEAAASVAAEVPAGAGAARGVEWQRAGERTHSPASVCQRFQRRWRAAVCSSHCHRQQGVFLLANSTRMPGKPSALPSLPSLREPSANPPAQRLTTQRLPPTTAPQAPLRALWCWRWAA